VADTGADVPVDTEAAPEADEPAAEV